MRVTWLHLLGTSLSSDSKARLQSETSETRTDPGPYSQAFSLKHLKPETNQACVLVRLGGAEQQYVADSLGFTIKRGGFMYGTVSESGEVAVDFIYEPPQQGGNNSLQIFRNEEEEKRVELIAAGLGMRRVGFIFSKANAPAGDAPRDYIVSGAEVRQTAALHAESELPEFATAIVKLEGTDGEDGNGADVHFEAFQLSDQCVRLYRTGWFSEGEAAEAAEPKVSRMTKDVVLAGRDTRDVDNDFMLVPVKIRDHQGMLRAGFPVENRVIAQDGAHLRAHLATTKGRPFYERIADFHLLLFLSTVLDPTTDIPQLAEAVRTKGLVGDGHQLIIDSL